MRVFTRWTQSLLLGVLLGFALAQSTAAQTRFTRAPVNLLAAPQHGYVYLSWSEVPNGRYVVHWRKVGERLWRDLNDQLEPRAAVPDLMDGTRYEFQVTARSGTASLASDIVEAIPGVRNECEAQEPFFCSTARLKEYMSRDDMQGQVLRCKGHAYTIITADMPNCEYRVDQDVVGLDRYVGSTFVAPQSVPAPAIARPIEWRAIWGKLDPFTHPERSPTLRRVEGADHGTVGEFETATGYVVGMNGGIHSQVTWFTPTSPVPGRYAIYQEGHLASAVVDGADVISFLLHQGWQVIALDMPFEGLNETDEPFGWEGAGHNFLHFEDDRAQNPVRYFYEPLKAVVDAIYDRDTTAAPTVMLLGRSGGAWMACTYAAMDQRIAVYVDISGCVPPSTYFDSAVFNPENIDPNHFELTIPALYDQISLTQLAVIGGTRGNFHFYNSVDPVAARFSETSPWVQYLRGLSMNGDRRVKVYIGHDRMHGLSAAAKAMLLQYLSQVGIGPVARTPTTTDPFNEHATESSPPPRR